MTHVLNAQLGRGCRGVDHGVLVGVPATATGRIDPASTARGHAAKNEMTELQAHGQPCSRALRKPSSWKSARCGMFAVADLGDGARRRQQAALDALAVVAPRSRSTNSRCVMWPPFLLKTRVIRRAPALACLASQVLSVP